MYVERLFMSNIRTFVGGKPVEFVHPDLDYRSPTIEKQGKDSRLPRPRLPNVTLLLGDNGSGKTTVLRALAASAFGPASKDLLRDSSIIRFGEATGTIRAALVLHEQDGPAGSRIEHEMLLERHGERLFVGEGPEFEPLWAPVLESDNDAFFVVGYGATRRVERLDRYDAGARAQSRATRDLRVWSLFEDSFSLIPLASWLPQLQKKNPGRYKQVVSLIDELLAPGHCDFTGKQDKQGDYLFKRGEMPIPFQSLSDGYRAFIGWVADLLFHICFGCPKGKKLVESKGLVLVDEIDLHLHPKWQLQVARTVSRALPNMQFVFTSHSPLVAGSLEWMNIISLRSVVKSNTTRVKRLVQSIHGLDADQVLLTGFFGLSSTMAPAKKRQLDAITERIRSGDKDAPIELIREMSSGVEVEE